jgi:hypothetical protein
MSTTEKLTAAAAPRVLGATRVLAGMLFAGHGLQKLLALWGGLPAGAPAGVIVAAGLVELAGGLLIARAWRVLAAAA